MYPELTPPLLVAVVAAAIGLGWLCVRRPILRRLALRQVARRRTEAVLVISGSILGTAIIVAALVVGDTLGFSVRQEAYRTLGAIDERVVSAPAVGGQISARLLPLVGTPDIDGVLSAHMVQAAAAHTAGGTPLAEPRVLAWDLDFAAAARFGRGGGSSGLDGPAPAAGRVVVNRPLADSLSARAGDTVTLYLGGKPRSLVVDRVIAERGIGGTGLGATVNPNAFLAPGTLAEKGLVTQGQMITWVSNRGGVEDGNEATSRVTEQIRGALGPLAAQAAVESPKSDVLRNADALGDSLGALFLMIGSFSIIAGALLLVNIFVMLAEERKGQLGVLRATGMKRSHLVGAFVLEGAVYAVIATAIGVGIGLGVGRGVAYIAAEIFGSFSVDSTGLDVTFAASATSLVNGAALGLLIGLATILGTSIRISRFNIIAAIRDLETVPAARIRRRRIQIATALAVAAAIAAVPSVARGTGVGTFLLPSAAAVCLAPLLTSRLGKRAAYSAVSLAVLAWALLANVLRPGVYDSPSMGIYVVLGSLLAFSSVVLLSENQVVLLRPIRRFIDAPTERALARRLAVSYPVAKRFRTGATLIMYTLIVLILALLTEIGGVLNHSVDDQIASSTAGYGVRIDFNPNAGSTGPLATLQAGPLHDRISAVTPLVSAPARSTDPGRRTDDLLSTMVVGVPAGAMRTMEFSERLPGLTTDAAVWDALNAHSDYVVVDAFLGAVGGPAGDSYSPGDTFSVTAPRTGTTRTKTIAGVLRNSMVFSSPLTPVAYPIVGSAASVREQFGSAAAESSAFVRPAPSVSAEDLAARLQGLYLSDSLVATPMAATIRRIFDANLAFFRLMQGFLALGLLVGITGLGVIMVRAVRERRRTIGVLRALGFQARTIERSFLLESGFVASEGIILGSVLGVVTTWLLYQRSAAFDGVRVGFPILWGTIAGIGVLTLIVSLLATAGPARRASGILPALATRTPE